MPEAHVTVTFQGGGADGEMQPMAIVGNSELTLPESGYYLDGLAFAGWEVDGVTYQPGDTIVVSGDTFASAAWAEAGGEGALEYGEEELVYGDEGAKDATDGEDNGLEVEVEEVAEEAAEEETIEGDDAAVEDATPSEVGCVFNGAGIAAIIAAAILAIAGAAIAVSRKRRSK